MRITRSFLILTILCLSLLPRFVSAQTVSDEVRRYMDRGQAAVEMANTPEDLNDAVKEFKKAIDLAPNWPDPYYSLGMAQNKMEQYDDALKNLRSYLQLAPNAGNAQEVKQIVNKIEYKKDKEGEVKRAVELLGSTECKIVSEKNSNQQGGPIWFFSKNESGVLGIENIWYAVVPQDDPGYHLWSGYVKGRPEYSPWVPVRINGRTFEFTFLYVMHTIDEGKKAYYVGEAKGKGEITSLDPIRIRTLVADRQTILIPKQGNTRKLHGESTHERVEECRALE